MQARIDLDRVQEQLIKERKVLLKRVEAERKKAKPSSMSNPDRADLALDYGDRARRLSLLEQLEDKLADIQEAIDRLKNGTYGICTNCGDAIVPERLEALPYAELCINCQQKT